MNKAPTLVIAAVVERDGLYLLCRRALKKRHGGYWEFPGGKLEEGESLLDAARRELLEELDLAVTSIGQLRFSVLDEASGFQINFVDVITTGEPKLIEHIELGWYSKDKILHLDLAPSDRAFAEQL